MTTKENILHGEKLAEKYYARLVEIKSIKVRWHGTLPSDGAPSERAIRILIDIQEEEITERVTLIEKKLAAYRKQWELEMEKVSAECNMHMNKIIDDAAQYIFKEPRAVTDLIQALVNKYLTHSENMEQEEKNSIFLHLRAHVKFLRNKIKK